MTNPTTEQVLAALSHIIDPDLRNDIVSLGFVKSLRIDGGTVSFALELTTPACPMKAHFQSRAETLVSAIDGVTAVQVTLTSRARPKATSPGGLSRVARIIAVSSCKGGVGKSTVAVNLAVALQRSGASVGLLDADVYGPSLPTLLGIAETGLSQTDGLLHPLERNGVKLMSFGFATPGGQAAIMRGPMVSGVIARLATETDWGELDYLVVDLPPGTGDIQLTLTQRLTFCGAVIVTTPQQLSLVDVVRGIAMFDTVKVPTLCIVENMGEFVCDGCGKTHRIFGTGALDALTEQYGIENTFALPLLPAVSATGDQGVPAVIADPDGPFSRVMSEVAAATVQEIEKIANNGIVVPTVHFSPEDGVVVTDGDVRRVHDPATLRRQCGCSRCRDASAGSSNGDEMNIPFDVVPTHIEQRGNYAVAIEWSDGHSTSIYPFSRLLNP